jgi:hypothetical protein
VRPNELRIESLFDSAPRSEDETGSERVNRALKALIENVNDSRFPATAKRKIVVTIEAEPDEERRDLKTFITVETKFPAEKAAGSMVYINTDAQTGETYATVGVAAKQGELPLAAAEAPELRAVPKAVGG